MTPTQPPNLSEIDENSNKLIFPGVAETFEYDPKHFSYVDTIESGRHVVKEYVFAPLNLKMAVKTIRIPQSRYQDDESQKMLRKLKQEIHSFRQLSNHENIVNFFGLCFGEGQAMIYSLASTFVGTLAYWPPERFVIANEKINVASIDEAKFPYDVRSDIWSLGITLTETVYGNLPFLDEKGETFDTDLAQNSVKDLTQNSTKSQNIISMQDAILNADRDEMISRCFGKVYSSECTKFVRSCLEEVDKRPKYDALMKEPFYCQSKENVKQEEFKEFIRKYEEAAEMQES
uniref:mitogen-activated protein kinase kinase n=1 Tax=Acrobeloides nanus TaxID=290746 RepID=A0A914DTQ6_9BILA